MSFNDASTAGRNGFWRLTLTLYLGSMLLISCLGQAHRDADWNRWTPPTDMYLELDAFLSYLVAEGSAWIQAERQRLRPGSGTLGEGDRERFTAYFRPETLGAMRYRMVDRIENPGFYAELSRQGIDIPLDFSSMDGIAFVDTVAIARQDRGAQDLTRLLFHETVHVAQYRYLGVDNFVSRYVHGWASSGFDYFTIPLEVQAYELERRFAQGEVFSVEDVVAGTLGEPWVQ